MRTCFTEGQKDRCNVAGYNKATKTCYLSMDDPQDVASVDDENIGVFYLREAQGIYLIFVFRVIPCNYSYT